jgi:hypothetical protein
MEYAIPKRSSKTLGGGTHYKLSPECGLVRGNLQWPGVLDMFSKSSHFYPVVFVDLLLHYAAKPLAWQGAPMMFELTEF